MAAVVSATASDLYSSATSSPAATMPTGIAAGHLLLTQLVFDGGSAVSITPPSGWTLYNRVNFSASGAVIAIFYRVANGSESSTYTYTLSASSAGSVQTLRITGQDATWEDASPTSRFANTDVIIATGLTTVTDDALCLIFTGTNSSGSTVPTEPSGWSTESVAPGTGSGRTWRIVSKTFPTAGAIADVSFPTMSGTRQWCSSMVAIRPSSGGTTDKSASDSATQTEGASSIAAAIAATDSATASDSGSIAAALSGSDTATLTEGATALAPAITANDTGALAEASPTLSATLTAQDSAALAEAAALDISGPADSGALSDSGAIVAEIIASDGATLSETSSVNTGSNPSASDASTLDDSATIAASIGATDSADATDTGALAAAIAGADSATIADASALAVSAGATDSGAMDEAAALFAQLAGVDSGALSETALIEILSDIAASDSGALSEGVSIVITPVNVQAPIYARKSGTAPRGGARTGTRGGPHTGAR